MTLFNNSVTTTWREQLWLPIKVLHFPKLKSPNQVYWDHQSLLKSAMCNNVSGSTRSKFYNMYKGHRVVYEGLVPLLEPPTSSTPAYYTRTYVYTCTRMHTYTTTYTHTHVIHTIDCSGCHCHIT